ncbi:hypothetical protein FACS1894103_7120 [Campylobacterota bacterium]|nr:hypothetical protein FACS1894103_7120 [Campylobacterota bacterium]
MNAHPELDEQRATVEAFFLSQSTFESELFMVNDSSELYEVMKASARSIIERPRARQTVNFKSLETYSQFRIEGCVLALKEQINTEIDYLIRKEAGFDAVIAQEVRNDQKKQAFVLEQSKKYFIQFQSCFKEAIAETFFERILAAVDMNMVDKVIQEVIDGVGAYAPVLIMANGASIVRKSDQIWMRLKQAKLAKEKELKAAQENYERLMKKVHGIELNIKAIEDARSLKLSEVQAMTLDELKEIVINEDGSRTALKRIFQYVPSGEIALYIAEQMDRGRRGGRNDIQKAEYKRATAFYENCHINNTAKELTNKSTAFITELPKVKEAFAAADKKIKTLEARGLWTYDDSLMKIRQAFIDNIGKTRL